LTDDVETERKCIASGEVQPKSGLIRFVVGPDNQIYSDVLEKLPGRGVWVSADPELLKMAVKKNLFSRASKQAVTVPDSLIADAEKGITKHLLDLISLARKAKLSVCGFEKVKGWLADGRAKVLLQASDGSTRGKGKLWTPEGGRYFGMLTAHELGLAFGRESVIHGALASGGLTSRVIEEASRLAGLRGIDGKGAVQKEKTTI
jgi:uncharacterized protein